MAAMLPSLGGKEPQTTRALRFTDFMHDALQLFSETKLLWHELYVSIIRFVKPCTYDGISGWLQPHKRWARARNEEKKVLVREHFNSITCSCRLHCARLLWCSNQLWWQARAGGQRNLLVLVLNGAAYLCCSADDDQLLNKYNLSNILRECRLLKHVSNVIL